MMSRVRCERGQTASEYLGVIVLVAAIVAALVASPIPAMVSDGVRSAVCRIAGSCESGTEADDEGVLETVGGGAVDFFTGAGEAAVTIATSDATHTTLDVVGLVPVLGEPADLLNAGIYAAEGDYVNAGLSAAGAIPIAGYGATAVKWGAKYGDEAVALFGRAATRGDDFPGISRALVKNGDEAAALYRANLFPRSALRDPDFVRDLDGVTRKAVTRGNAADVLAANMRIFNGGATRPPGTVAHHMVPFAAGTSPEAAAALRQAAAARRHLQRLGVDVNSAANGVFLPAAYHRSLHTHEYYIEIASRVRRARSGQEAVAVLDRIRRELLEGKFPN